MNPEDVKRKVKCCSCGTPLRNSKHINIVFLQKMANWEWPSWGNILVGVWGFACAVLCDDCVKHKKKPKFAVEWNEDLSVIKYHPIEELDDMQLELTELLTTQRIAG